MRGINPSVQMAKHNAALGDKIIPEKECVRCKETRHFKYFFNDPNEKDGKMAYCRSCFQKEKMALARERRKRDELEDAEINMGYMLLQEGSRTATNSDFLSKHLLQRGLGINAIQKILKRLCNAKLYIFNKNGRRVHTQPDYQTQKYAAEILIKIHGFNFQPKQEKQEVPVNLVQFYNSTKERSLEEIDAEIIERTAKLPPEQRRLLLATLSDDNGNSQTKTDG